MAVSLLFHLNQKEIFNKIIFLTPSKTKDQKNPAGIDLKPHRVRASHGDKRQEIKNKQCVFPWSRYRF